jgi:hypothetical protein
MNYVSVKWTQHRIAGVYHHYKNNIDGYERLRARRSKDEGMVTFDLVRDPTNKYDKNAIQVVDRWSGRLLGWVPKEENTQLALLMDTLPIKVTADLVYNKSTFSNQRLFMEITIQFPAIIRINRDDDVEEDEDGHLPTPKMAAKACRDWLGEDEDEPLVQDKRTADAEDLLARIKARGHAAREAAAKRNGPTPIGKAALAALGASMYDLDI